MAKKSLLRSIYEELFPIGITVLFGRPGVGKSRLAYSITEEFAPESVLVIPKDTTDAPNLREDVIVTNAHDIQTIIRATGNIGPKALVIDDTSKLSRLDMHRHSGKLKRMAIREQCRIVLIAQLRVIPTTNTVYPHNVAANLQSCSEELAEMLPVAKSRDMIMSLIRCKESGKRLQLPVSRIDRIKELDIIYMLQDAYPGIKPEDLLPTIISSMNSQTKRDDLEKLSW